MAAIQEKQIAQAIGGRQKESGQWGHGESKIRKKITSALESVWRGLCQQMCYSILKQGGRKTVKRLQQFFFEWKKVDFYALNLPTF